IRTMRQRASEGAKAFKKKYPSARIEKVKIFGLGGSAAPHDIARGIIDCYQKSGVEIEVVRSDTPNPDYIDKNTLVVLASFSGNTEETINSYKIIKHKAKLSAAITKGGELTGIADQNDIPLIQLPKNEDHPAYVLQPRESVCLQLTAILTFLASIGLKAGGNGRYSRSDIDFKRISELIRKWRNRFGPRQPFKRNSAKQLAFFVLFGIKYKGGRPRPKFEPWSKRIPYIIGDLNLRALVHEVATQFRERSKLNVAEGITPEDLHNTVESIRARIESAQAGVDDDPYVYMFIDSPDSERRIDFRVKKTRELVMGRKARYAVLTTEGDTSFERALFLTYFNAHMTTYAALLNGFDPLPVPTMSWMKEVMKGYKRGSKAETEVINKRQNSLQICEK
ncbi:MAG: hypothetical protein JSV03_07945, partial [Planctomycetota bacterium]